MNIVVGYLPTPEGTAALDHALFLARRDGGRLVVVNTGRRGKDGRKPPKPKKQKHR